MSLAVQDSLKQSPLNNPMFGMSFYLSCAKYRLGTSRVTCDFWGDEVL